MIWKTRKNKRNVVIKNGQASADYSRKKQQQPHFHAFLLPLLVSSEEKAWQVILFPGTAWAICFSPMRFCTTTPSYQASNSPLLQQLLLQPQVYTQQQLLLLQNSPSLVADEILSHVRCYGISICAHPDSKNRRGWRGFF